MAQTLTDDEAIVLAALHGLNGLRTWSTMTGDVYVVAEGNDHHAIEVATQLGVAGSFISLALVSRAWCEHYKLVPQ